MGSPIKNSDFVVSKVEKSMYLVFAGWRVEPKEEKKDISQNRKTKMKFPAKLNRIQLNVKQIMGRFVQEFVRVDGCSPSDLHAIRIPIRFRARI
jgi:hypothetical protein